MNSFVGALVALFVSVSTAFQPIPATDADLEPPDPRVAQLSSFLETKRSPLPADVLLQYDNWRIMVALANAESSYGRFLGGTHNAWGIKDFRSGSPKFGKTRDFGSWEESIAYTSELLYKYAPDGTPEPQHMVAKWKYVQPYAHWVNNVSYALYDINKHVEAKTTTEPV